MLPIKIKHGSIVFNKKAGSSPVAIRTAEEVKSYLKDPQARIKAKKAYLMYRNACWDKDKDLFGKNRLRFDITVIPPQSFGKELAKTIGHFHIKTKGKDYPEIYEVLSGNAMFLFQDKTASEIYLLAGEAGQKVIVPPGFGHITMNSGKTPLVLADIFADDIGSSYDFFKKNRGGAYYIGREKDGFSAEKNRHYKKVGKINFGSPEEVKKLGIDFKKSLYDTFISHPERFAFLRNPQKFKSILKPDNLFKFN